MIEILTGLPSRLSCIIMQDWLNLKSVLNLDSAFCCHSHRSKFTDLVQSEEYFIRDQVTITKESKILRVLHRFGAKLRSVVFSSKLTSKQRKSIVVRCQNLTHVRFLHYGTYAHALRKALNNNLITLDLSGTHLDNTVLLQIAQFSSSACTLGLADLLLWDTTLIEFTKSCTHIMHLDISDNRALTDSGILTAVMNLKSLRGLNIKGCSDLTDASLVHIYTHCANTLHTLQMNCRTASDSRERLAPVLSVPAICALLENCTHLRTFQIIGLAPYGDVPIQIPSTALCNITTIVLDRSVYIANIDEESEFCANVHTLIADILYKPASLAQVFIRCCNLRETHFYVHSFDVEQCSDIIKYSEGLVDIYKSFKPQTVVKCVHSSGEYAEYDVMRM